MQVSSVNKDLIRPAELWLYFKNDMQKFEKPVPSPIAVFFKDLQKSFSWNVSAWCVCDTYSFPRARTHTCAHIKANTITETNICVYPYKIMKIHILITSLFVYTQRCTQRSNIHCIYTVCFHTLQISGNFDPPLPPASVEASVSFSRFTGHITSKALSRLLASVAATTSSGLSFGWRRVWLRSRCDKVLRQQSGGTRLNLFLESIFYDLAFFGLHGL